MVEVPFALVALIVKVAVGNSTVGVPVITPVDVLKDNPVGNVAPVMVQVEAAPPVLIGFTGVIGAPTEKLTVAGE